MAKYKSIAEAVKDIQAKGRVKIVANKSGHNIPLGIYKVAYVNPATSPIQMTLVQQNGVNYNTYSYQLTDLESIEETREELEKRIGELKEQIKEEESKLSYMEEAGTDVYIENEFKVYKTLLILKGKKSDIEKAKVIASLING